MPHKILVVDDEAEIADLIETYLADENYTIFKFYSARDALACIETTDLDLAILDVMLPDIDGFALCKKIREKHTWPIIMLTAKDAETDKITGLTLGADDYVTKPFRPLELATRDQKAHACSLNGEPVDLTPTEFSILRILLENRGAAVSAEELFHQIWKDEYYSKSNNTITVHIRHLREKLGDSTEKPKYIKTVWGVGYKIEANG